MTVSLVTGGAGFIGSHISEGLLKRGDEVRIFDNFSTGNLKNVASIEGEIEIIAGDIRDEDAIFAASKGCDYIFHQAAFVSVPLSLENPQECYAINIEGTQNILEAARNANCSRVVLASSAAVYGDNQEMPLNESMPLHPLSPYAASKQADEIFADLYTMAFGLPVVALRYFNVYGPRQSPKSDYAAAIPIFIRKMLDGESPTVFGDGGQTRDFIYIDDVVRANILASEHNETAGEIFNVCSGEAVSILDLLEKLADILPEAQKHNITDARKGDIYHSIGAPGKYESVAGFTTQVSLDDGLRNTVEWMQR